MSGRGRRVVNPDGSYANGPRVGYLRCVCGCRQQAHAPEPVGCSTYYPAQGKTQRRKPCDCKGYRPDFSPEWVVPGKVALRGLASR